jgi:hypothetical protein
VRASKRGQPGSSVARASEWASTRLVASAGGQRRARGLQRFEAGVAVRWIGERVGGAAQARLVAHRGAGELGGDREERDELR